jgi:hypothetical protein
MHKIPFKLLIPFPGGGNLISKINNSTTIIIAIITTTTMAIATNNPIHGINTENTVHDRNVPALSVIAGTEWVSRPPNVKLSQR